MMSGGTAPGAFTTTASGMIAGTVFVTLLIAACVTDVRTRRIPNRLVLWLASLGILYSVAAHPWRTGAARAGEGLLLGLALWLPFYLLHWLGAGDVKLFAGASAWLGAGLALRAALLAALFGGVLSLIWMAYTQGWWVTLVRVRHGLFDPMDSAGASPAAPGRRRIPYGLAMTAGLIAAAWLPQLLG
ncbi:MAG TPA: prepilin peptidase [Gemmatimonadaceae bacterium]